MTVAVDLDEVLAETLRAAIAFHNGRYGTGWLWENSKTSRFWELWGQDEAEKWRKSEEFCRSRNFKKIEPVIGSIAGINCLIKVGHCLFIVTTRPTFLEDATRSWLSKYFPQKFEEVYFSPENQKSAICQKIGAAVLIDDDFGNALECAQQEIPVILLSRPWNKSFVGNELIKISSAWSGVTRLIGDRL